MWGKPGLRLDNADFFYNFIEGSVMAYLTASNGWKGLIAAVAVYEVLCAEDELLSRGFDRLLVKHPVWPRVLVVAFALHLINWFPRRVDPVSMLFHVTRKSRAIAKGRKRGGNAHKAADERPESPLPRHRNLAPSCVGVGFMAAKRIFKSVAGMH